MRPPEPGGCRGTGPAGFVHRLPAVVASFASGGWFKVPELHALHIQLIDGHAEEPAMADPGNP